MKIRTMGILLLAFAATGCIRLEQELTIREDGSATLEIDYSIAEQSVQQFKGLLKLEEQLAAVNESPPAVGPGTELTRLFLNPDEADLRKAFKTYEPMGMTVTKLEVTTRNARQEIKMEAQIADLAKIAEADFFRAYGFSLQRTEDGNYVLHRDAALKDRTAVPNYADQETTRILTPLMGGFTVSLGVRTPGRIMKTNAAKRSLYSAQWVFEFDTDPNVISNLQLQPFSVVFEGSDMTLPTIQAPKASTKPAQGS